YPLLTHYDRNGAFTTELNALRKGLLADLEKEKMKDEDRNSLITQVLIIESMHPETITRLDALLHRGVSKQMQKHIITELGRTTSPLVAETLLKNYAKLSSENRALALATLLRRSEWAMTLLAALRDRTIPVNDLGVQGPGRLLNHPDPAVARKAAAVLEALHALPQRSKDALIAAFRPAFAKPA